MRFINSVRERFKEENRIVSWWLLHYEEVRQELEERRNEILHRGEHTGIVAALKQPHLRNPTMNKALELASLDEKNEWLEVVEEVEASLSPEMKIFLRLRREAEKRGGAKQRGRPAWIAYVQHKYAEEIAKRKGKDIEDVWVNAPETFVRWWEDIVNFAARVAARRGLI